MLLNITRKRPKRIFLSEKDKDYLLEKLTEIERTIKQSNLKEESMDLSVIWREYFVKILKVHLTFTNQDIET